VASYRHLAQSFIYTEIKSRREAGRFAGRVKYSRLLVCASVLRALPPAAPPASPHTQTDNIDLFKRRRRPRARRALDWWRPRGRHPLRVWLQRVFFWACWAAKYDGANGYGLVGLEERSMLASGYGQEGCQIRNKGTGGLSAGRSAKSEQRNWGLAGRLAKSEQRNLGLARARMSRG
jgi:hypothetical protein